MNKDYFLPASVLIAGVLISGAVIYNAGLKGAAPSGNQPANISNPNPSPEVSLKLNSEDVILGDAGAPVTVIEYGDFQCPFCGRFFSQTEPLLKENYVRTGKVRFVYRHFAFLGPESVESAKAAECAKDQGKFWQFHDALFSAEIQDGQERNGNLNVSLFKSIAGQLKMNLDSFSVCLASNKYADKVQKDYQSGIAAGAQATPTIFINGQKVEGAVPFSNFKTIIDNLLTK